MRKTMLACVVLVLATCSGDESGTTHHGVLLGQWTVSMSGRGIMPSELCSAVPLPVAVAFASKVGVRYVDGAVLEVEWVETATGFTAGEEAMVDTAGKRWFLNGISGSLSQYDKVLDGVIILNAETGDSCPVTFTATHD
jgi:hypothetical protein